MKSIRAQLKEQLDIIDNANGVKCINCSLCEDANRGEFAKCSAMYLSNEEYIPKNMDKRTGFSMDSAYISLLIQDNKFPNKDGNCIFYKKKWYKFWVK